VNPGGTGTLGIVVVMMIAPLHSDVYCITRTVLKRQADTTFDDRSRGQVMADTLVERVTGRPAEEPEPWR
jgi:hypothetical protein